MESQNKSVAFQWIVPSVVLMVVVLIMLFDFSSKSSKEASELVYKDLISKTENYADNLCTELRQMHSVAAPMAELLKRNGVADTKYVQQILEITAQCSEAHQVLYCDLEGNGYNENGEKIAIGDKTFFETAGFEEQIDDKNIIPNYFGPFVQKNIDIWTRAQDKKTIFFKGDGDQDRPSK